MKHKLFTGVLLAGICISAAVSAQTIKVTLLGTGVPQPSIERFGPATVVEANGQYFLFDCGRGASQRLWQKKIQLGKVNKLFLTHLHSDHVVGIPDFWLTGWLPTPFGKRTEPLQVWGPAGTVEMMDALQKAFAWDISVRSEEGNKADSGIMVKASAVSEGVVYDEGGVRITAFLVNHSDVIDSALGYRLDFAGHSVVISGDTRYSENLVKHAKDVDVLVHEVAVARPELVQRSAVARQILGYHTSPEEAGKIFSLTKPRLAVYSHIVLLSLDPTLPPPGVDDIITGTKKHFNGQFEVGDDLMTIEIGDKVEIKRFQK